MELTVGVAVWVAVCVGVAVEVEVGVGVCAEGVGVGVNACSAGVCEASGVAVEVAAGSCAMAMPPSTAAYRPAQHRAMAKIFFGDRLTGASFTRAWAACGRQRLSSTSASRGPRLSMRAGLAAPSGKSNRQVHGELHALRPLRDTIGIMPEAPSRLAERGGALIEGAADRSRTSMRTRFDRLRLAWRSIVQASVAATAAYLIATEVVGHSQPFFAPVVGDHHARDHRRPARAAARSSSRSASRSGSGSPTCSSC